MRGEQAALIVQAEEHVKQAIRELRAAQDRCNRLYLLTQDVVVKIGMATIVDRISGHIDTLQEAKYGEEFHKHWDS